MSKKNNQPDLEAEENVITEETTNEAKDQVEPSENEGQEAATDTKAQENLSPEEQMAKENEELKAQVAELKDKYLRVYSDFENFRKRNMRERLELINTASQDTMAAILPILDDFDRAKKSADAEDSAEQFSEGVELVYQKIYTVLGNKGLQAMESTGLAFDPELHSAVTEIPAPTEDMKGKVIDTIEKGYKLKDKIIRHAKVVVGK